MTAQCINRSLNTKRYRDALRERVITALGHGSFRALAAEFGVNHETLRRWLRGDSHLPAWFVAEVALRRGIDPALLMFGTPQKSNGTLNGVEDPGRVALAAIDRIETALRRNGVHRDGS